MTDTDSDLDADANADVTDRRSRGQGADTSADVDGDADRNTGTLALTDVTKRYGETTALEDLTLEFRPGTFHGLIGPNGSGKTTLFALLAGLVRPSSGRIERDDAVTVGYSFQEPRFYPDLTVRENLEIFRGFGDDPPPASWIETLLAELRLEPAADRRAGELSGGFRKKLDLGLALVKRPQFLLLDEPLADVDDYSRRRIRAFLEDYRRDDRTIVISTHNVAAFAETLDRLTVLVDGELRFDGVPDDDVVEQYRELLD
ncbi:ATP-binding cassette domain-containing protein [Natronorubrum sp. JWXQ-INN-674]|uniref:ATP-binding cassette domain-containing protein n=1 Tax=Natronorubrum halalkaliphilum TaxID=2691917 RepID=A0A6B0VSZ1_9EURY|nr:ABC transporter ATP-binding protein [Natronorubrum halalkaliphilum]MXV63902.1 ATP-binding cassette domain-containing protein [Natronorubrum halalkaliphilum]